MEKHSALNNIEMGFAYYLGNRRNNHAAHLEPAHGFKGDPVAIHILGVAGEMAFCKYVGIYYDPTIDTFKGPDVLTNIQVRTRSKSAYQLLVRPGDRDDEIFVHVDGSQSPVFRIMGWLYGWEAKREEWLRSYGGRPPAYFPPNSRLRDPERLKEWINEKRSIQTEKTRKA